jgi:hypothetical protein
LASNDRAVARNIVRRESHCRNRVLRIDLQST